MIMLLPRSFACSGAFFVCSVTTCYRYETNYFLVVCITEFRRSIYFLLGNAFIYLITVRWRVEGKRAIFTIDDTGPGIPPQDLPHIFEPLYRVEKSRNPETGGIGLGLTIAKRIFKAHGGDLSAANRVQGGAEFVGWLPLGDQLTPHRDAKAEREGKEK
jgi:signal transduction histidine kinase